MIPKRIFYVWGINDAPKQNMWLNIQTWKRVLPDYEIIEINEDSKKYFDFQRELANNKWFRAVYERKMWAYVADYVRAKVLYEHGGIYMDTDVTVLQSFDKFLSEPAFVGIQSSGQWNLVEPAILGGQRGNKFIKRVLDFYDDGIWREPIYTMPMIFKYFLERDYGVSVFPSRDKQDVIKLADITLYPEKYFVPFEYGQSFDPKCLEPETCTIHWFGGSWTRPDVRFFLENKHRIDFSKPVLDKHAVRLFNVLPICWVIQSTENTDTVCKYKLFGVLPILRTRRNPGRMLHFYLFNILPFIKIYRTDDLRIKVYLFGLISVLKIKKVA